MSHGVVGAIVGDAIRLSRDHVHGVRAVFIEDDGVLVVVAEVLAHGGAGVGAQELEGGGVGGGSSDDDAVVYGHLLVKTHTDVDAREGV